MYGPCRYVIAEGDGIEIGMFRHGSGRKFLSAAEGGEHVRHLVPIENTVHETEPQGIIRFAHRHLLRILPELIGRYAAGLGNIRQHDIPQGIDEGGHLQTVGRTHPVGDIGLHRRLERTVPDNFNVYSEFIEQPFIKHYIGCNSPPVHEPFRMNEHPVGGGREPVDRLRINFVVSYNELARLLETQQLATQLLHIAVIDRTRTRYIDIYPLDIGVRSGKPDSIGHLEHRIGSLQPSPVHVESPEPVIRRIDYSGTKIHHEDGIRRNIHLPLSEGGGNPSYNRKQHEPHQHRSHEKRQQSGSESLEKILHLRYIYIYCMQ